MRVREVEVHAQEVRREWLAVCRERRGDEPECTFVLLCVPAVMFVCQRSKKWGYYFSLPVVCQNYSEPGVS